MATRTTTSRSTTSPAAATKTTPAKAPKAAKPATETPKTAAAPKAKAAATEAAPPPAKSAKKETAPAKTATQVTPEQRLHYVAEAAYFIAERRGFAGGTEHDDWTEAEVLIDRMLAGDTKH